MRSEEDKVTQAPLVVALGGKEYEVRLLTILEARAWRKQMAKMLGALPAYAKATTDDAPAFEAAVSAMLSTMPDQVADLFFAYAKDLPRDEIEKAATEVELALAFDAVMAVAFPLLRSLTGAMAKVAQ